MKQYTCSFTGHRPFKLPYGFEEDHPDCVRLKLMLGMEIESLFFKGYDTFLCGMCWGADIWCAECVLEMRRAFPMSRIRLRAVLPFEEHHKGWTSDYQERYFNILSQADACLTVSPSYWTGVYQQRNKYMIDRSDCLLAVWDGQPGGTRNAVEYAKRKGLEVIVFDPVGMRRERTGGG